MSSVEPPEEPSERAVVGMARLIRPRPKSAPLHQGTRIEVHGRRIGEGAGQVPHVVALRVDRGRNKTLGTQIDDEALNVRLPNGRHGQFQNMMLSSAHVQRSHSDGKRRTPSALLAIVTMPAVPDQSATLAHPAMLANGQRCRRPARPPARRGREHRPQNRRSPVQARLGAPPPPRRSRAPVPARRARTARAPTRPRRPGAAGRRAGAVRGTRLARAPRRHPWKSALSSSRCPSR